MNEVPLYIRSTDITSLAECQLKWWLSHLFRDEAPGTVWFALGTAIHAAIEQHLLHDIKLDEAVAYANLVYLEETYGKEVMESPSTRAKRSAATVEADIQRMMEKYYTWREADFCWLADKKLEKVEHIATADYNGLQLRTQIDSVWSDDRGFMHIVDWKSGGTAGKAKNLQLWFYQYIGRREGWMPKEQRYPGVFVHLDFLDGQKGIQYAGEYPGDVMMERWIQTTIDQKLMSKTNGPLPREDWWCNYCQVAQFCPTQDNDVEYEADVMTRVEDSVWLNEYKEANDG